MKTPMTTNDVRTALAEVMTGLRDGTMDKGTAQEISNAAGKFVSTIKVDLLGQMMAEKIVTYKHPALELHQQESIEAA